MFGEDRERPKGVLIEGETGCAVEGDFVSGEVLEEAESIDEVFFEVFGTLR